MVDIRRLGGALTRTPGHLNHVGRGEARFSMNAVGATFTPEMAEGARTHLARLVEATRPHQTGEQYVNLMELDAVSAERARAAYPSEDWDRPVALKDRYNPDNLFGFNRNIAPAKSGR
jgi:Berberine and berberine like